LSRQGLSPGPLAIRRKASRVLWSAPMSASRIGHGMFQALDCAGSKADELGCLEHPRTVGEFAACGLEFLGVGVKLGSSPPQSLHRCATMFEREMIVARARCQICSARRYRSNSSKPSSE